LVTQQSIKGHGAGLGIEQEIRSVVISRDGKVLVWGDERGTVKVWDTTAGSLLRSITAGTRAVGSVAVTQDGSVAISGGGSVRSWQVATGKQIRAEQLLGDVAAVAISADGTTIVAASQLGDVRVWDLAAWTQPSARHRRTSSSNRRFATASDPARENFTTPVRVVDSFVFAQRFPPFLGVSLIVHHCPNVGHTGTLPPGFGQITTPPPFASPKFVCAAPTRCSITGPITTGPPPEGRSTHPQHPAPPPPPPSPRPRFGRPFHKRGRGFPW
jgi:hypothetical protein